MEQHDDTVGITFPQAGHKGENNNDFNSANNHHDGIANASDGIEVLKDSRGMPRLQVVRCLCHVNTQRDKPYSKLGLNATYLFTWNERGSR